MEFMSFDSYEGMQAAMQERHDAAIKVAEKVPQCIRDAMKPGTFAVSVDPSGGFLEYYEIWESKDPVDKANMEHDWHLRLAKIKSPMYPEGELGVVWISMIVPIPESVYKYAEEMAFAVNPPFMLQIAKSNCHKLMFMKETFGD